MGLLLAIDQGTTSSRAMLLDADGRVLQQASEEFTQHFPQPGWVEHDPADLLDTVVRCVRRVLATATEPIAALGITNQRETTIVWERRSGRAVAPAIVWQDRRTTAVTDALRSQGAEELVRSRSGLVCDPYFSASKIAWLLDEHDLRARASQGELLAGTVDSWLLWHLTGEHVTDVSNAARTALFDIHTLAWSAELCDLFRVPMAILPAVRPSMADFGLTDPDLFGRALPVRAIAGDQQAALFGQACLEAGQVKATYGTGGFIMAQTGTEVQAAAGCLTTVAWQRSGASACYALEASIFICGAAVQWLRDQLGLIDSAGAIEALAREAPDSGGVVFVPAFVGLGTPQWDAHARGLLIGLGRDSGPAQIARATLEAMAMQTVDACEAIATGGLHLPELRVDGGATANDLLLQLQADFLQLPVLRPQLLESTVAGVAAMAAVSADLLDEAGHAARWAVDRHFRPAADAASVQAARRRWQRAVQRCGAWADDV